MREQPINQQLENLAYRAQYRLGIYDLRRWLAAVCGASPSDQPVLDAVRAAFKLGQQNPYTPLLVAESAPRGEYHSR